jgi:hypothetical protein
MTSKNPFGLPDEQPVGGEEFNRAHRRALRVGGATTASACERCSVGLAIVVALALMQW